MGQTDGSVKDLEQSCGPCHSPGRSCGSEPQVVEISSRELSVWRSSGLGLTTIAAQTPWSTLRHAPCERPCQTPGTVLTGRVPNSRRAAKRVGTQPFSCG